MSLAQVLFYSTMAVKKIRNFIKKYDDCTLIPCTLSGYEKKISNLLNVPLLSPDPSVGGKIGSRSIMKKVYMYVCICVYMYIYFNTCPSVGGEIGSRSIMKKVYIYVYMCVYVCIYIHIHAPPWEGR
jgi:hypothetical protein